MIFTNNALLWGARGNGKSTLIKSTFNEISSSNNQLKIIQLNKSDIGDIEKRHCLMQAMDTVNDSYGKMKVRFAINGFERKWKLKQERLSPCYTTHMNELLQVIA